MFKKAFILIFINTCLFYLLLAQNNLGNQITNAKFQVVKAAIELLAAEKLTVSQVEETKCRDCKSYDDLKKFGEENKISGVIKFTDYWKAAKIDTSSQHAKSSLRAFTERIADSLFIGGQKPKRKLLPGYSSFEVKIKAILVGVVIKQDNLKPQQTIHPQVAGTDQAPGVGAGDSTSQRPKEPEIDDEETTATFNLEYLVFGEAAIIIILAFIIILKIQDSKKKYRKQRIAYSKTKEGEINQLENALFSVRNLEIELKELQVINEELQSTIDQLKQKSKDNAAPIVAPPIAELAMLPQTSIASPIEIKFARYADAGDGFSNAELLTREDDETIFEITILTATTAEYRVTGNSAAQKYALANASYFLSKSCKYETFPSGSIITDVPGELRLQGNKWQITALAKISFISS
jgi:hypothetical protein